MLTIYTRSVLESFGQQITQQLVEAIKTKPVSNFGTSPVNASGNLARSVRYEVDDDGVTIYAAEYVYYLEYGRMPTRNGGDGTLYDRIYQWITDKGIAPDTEQEHKSMAFAITKTIHAKGTTIYREHRGKPSGLLSDIITGSALERLRQQLVPKLVDQVVSVILKDFNSSAL